MKGARRWQRMMWLAPSPGVYPAARWELEVDLTLEIGWVAPVSRVMLEVSPVFSIISRTNPEVGRNGSLSDSPRPRWTPRAALA